MSDDCMGCAMFRTQKEDIARAAANQTSNITNLIERLIIMIESDEIDEVLAELKELSA